MSLRDGENLGGKASLGGVVWRDSKIMTTALSMSTEVHNVLATTWALEFAFTEILPPTYSICVLSKK